MASDALPERECVLSVYSSSNLAIVEFDRERVIVSCIISKLEREAELTV